VVQTSLTNFTLRGDVTQPLFPGALAPVNVRITNPFAFAIRVTGITVTPKQATTKNGQPNPGCDGTVNLRFTQQFTGSPVTVGAGATRSLSELGVPEAQWPLLTMPNLATNQDACKGTSFSFSYSGTATEVTP
jgi:hypothetical protein